MCVKINIYILCICKEKYVYDSIRNKIIFLYHLSVFIVV